MSDHERRRSVMAASDVARVLDEWAAAWLAHDTERILALFTDDCVYEDYTVILSAQQWPTR